MARRVMAAHRRLPRKLVVTPGQLREIHTLASSIGP